MLRKPSERTPALPAADRANSLWTGRRSRATALTTQQLPGELAAAEKWKNSKSYERTRQLTENKEQEISSPVNSLKVSSLTSLTCHAIENMTVMPEKRAAKKSEPVNLLKLNMVSCSNPVNSLKIKTLTKTEREAAAWKSLVTRAVTPPFRAISVAA